MPQDNASGGPMIPAGTERTVYGTNAFTQQQSGQAPNPAPVVNTQQPQVANAAPEGAITFADLAAKKGFNSPDDLAKAYANLESHNKKVEMTAADIIKAINQDVAPQPQAVMQQPAIAPVQPQVQPQAQSANPDDAAIQIVKAIVQNEVKPLQQTVELQQLFLNNPDAKEYAVGIAEVVKRNPGIKWDDAYKLAKFDAAQQNASQSGRQEAYQAIQQKQNVIAGTAQPQSRTTPDVQSIIKDRSVPFKEVDRIVRETLARMNQ